MKDSHNDNKLNIAYICREFGPVTGGGIGTYVYNVCMAMVDRGHRVFLVTDCFNETNVDQLPQGITLISVINTPDYRKNSFVSSSHEYSYRVYDTLSDLVRKKKIDIAEFAEFGCEGFATIRSKKTMNQFRDTKLIVKLHTPSSLLFKINEDKRLEVDSCCTYAMEDYCVRNADMVTSPSLSLGEYFKKRVGRNNIVKCPYPMELPKRGTLRKFTGEQVRRVRFIGSVQIRKGIDSFVAAARLVLEKDDGFLFEVWGADRSAHTFGRSYTKSIQEHIPDDLKEKIVFCGGIPYSEIPALYRESCFCIFPSRWENWANVCLEAMSYGCIVFASKEGGMSEMVEHGKSGFLIDPLDPVMIADLVMENSYDIEALHSLSVAAQERSIQVCDPLETTRRIEKNYLESYSEKHWVSIASPSPLVSVVIPYYNQPEYLQETVKSVQNSDYENIEIVVVNDGSTTELANECFEKLTGVTKISKKNGGLSSARNAGIAVAKGEFIIPLDADDIIEPTYISRGVEALINNPELGYVSCHAMNFGEFDNAYIPLGYVPELMLFINTHGKCSNVFKKEIFIQCGGYDEMMTSYEDWDFLITLEENGILGDVLPDEFFKYRRHYNSMVYETANRQRSDLIQYMMIKHSKALEQSAAQMAIVLGRLWKETEILYEFAQQQLANKVFEPAQMKDLVKGNRTKLQVYSQRNGQYWEHNSVYLDYPEKIWHELKLNLPFQGHDGTYRVDPSNSFGIIIIRDLVVRDRKTLKKFFHASGDNDFSGCNIAGNVEYSIQSGFLVICAYDNDPQIQLPVFPFYDNVILEISLFYSSVQEINIKEIINDAPLRNLKYKSRKFLCERLCRGTGSLR